MESRLAPRMSTCGKWSACCSSGRTGRFEPRTAASPGGELDTRRSRSSIPIASRSSIRAASAGPLRRSSRLANPAVWHADQRKSSYFVNQTKSRVGFVIGSCRACRSASSNRLDSASPRVFSAATDSWKSATARRFLGQDLLRRIELGAVGALGLLVADDPRRLAPTTSVAGARTGGRELGLQGHDRVPSARSGRPRGASSPAGA